VSIIDRVIPSVVDCRTETSRMKKSKRNAKVEVEGEVDQQQLTVDDEQ
jgi:hypothetical protein